MSRAGRVPAGGDEAAGGGDAGIPGSAEMHPDEGHGAGTRILAAARGDPHADR